MARSRAYLTAVIVLVACGDPYAHTNPYDPAVPVDIQISGPDSLFSDAELGQYTVHTTPAFPDTAVTWLVDTVSITNSGGRDTVVDGAGFLKPSGAGSFQSIAPPLEPATLTVAVAAAFGGVDTTVSRFFPPPIYATVTIQTTQYRHVAFKSVVLTQRLRRIQLRCPDLHACDPLAAGGTWAVWVDGFDALGHEVASLTGPADNPATGNPIATFTVRDTTVAQAAPVGIRAATVTAKKAGSTWVVGARGALFDSLQVVVH